MLLKKVKVGNIEFGNHLPFVLIAGPCQIESRDHALKMAEKIHVITNKLNIPYIYKSSYDKANRTSISSKRGVGLETGLNILSEVKRTFGCPIITDVHTVEQCNIAAEYVDILQIPALLCRQTDLLVAAAITGRTIHVKKGQFLAPWDMQSVVNKISQSGNENILLCERGTSFGYNNLINDMRSLPLMSKIGYPVIFDATHSVQSPGKNGGIVGSTGGNRDMISHLARAAVAIGIAGVFLETHDNPDEAPCDGPNMLNIENLSTLLEILKRLDNISKEYR